VIAEAPMGVREGKGINHKVTTKSTENTKKTGRGAEVGWGWDEEKRRKWKGAVFSRCVARRLT